MVSGRGLSGQYNGMSGSGAAPKNKEREIFQLPAG
jgi:hypothetical protein